MSNEHERIMGTRGIGCIVLNAIILLDRQVSESPAAESLLFVMCTFRGPHESHVDVYNISTPEFSSQK
jgi:hypothetical protein